ncbi:hypothetical protein NO1_1105 [Candidatus Termititenax aidoneus]|uniref:Uncharacterized protein n=1 Tax=Termititenax aidoneus TaxID=2218524 RepID=A0A388TD73_TERA1|nr:hypothetical protein NO1_1105 [Candidatus Termititenax aidoneus]
MAMQLYTYLAGISQASWGQTAYRIQNAQHTPELITIEQKTEEFQKNCTEKYLPAMEQIKKDFGWDLPENERNEDNYQIAYSADWYKYTMALPLKDTIFLNLRSDEQKIRALDAWEKEIQDFIQSHSL